LDAGLHRTWVGFPQCCNWDIMWRERVDDTPVKELEIVKYGCALSRWRPLLHSTACTLVEEWHKYTSCTRTFPSLKPSMNHGVFSPTAKCQTTLQFIYPYKAEQLAHIILWTSSKVRSTRWWQQVAALRNRPDFTFPAHKLCIHFSICYFSTVYSTMSISGQKSSTFNTTAFGSPCNVILHVNSFYPELLGLRTLSIVRILNN
jgi:hypothetical protein